MMEFERIQQLSSAARVVKTGSEQQRRRREQNTREFSELLEENLEEEPTEQDAASPQPASPDIVSFSSAGKVGAETLRAAGNLARISIAQRQLLELFNPGMAKPHAGPTMAQPVKSKSDADPAKVDELA
jgi:hypothetical protein